MYLDDKVKMYLFKLAFSIKIDELLSHMIKTITFNLNFCLNQN